MKPTTFVVMPAALKFIPFSFLFACISLFGYGQELFIAPVDTPFQLSGTFGELRQHHFHSGLDFRTGGKEGAAVKAAMSGWVSRIKVSAGGFGNVIYLDHSQGFTTVYAHLHHFTASLANYVDSAQLSAENFEVELFPDSGRFFFKQGDLLAISGNSGSSEAPHLHFEIRDRYSQEPMNPLCYIQDATDSLAPVSENLILYSLHSGHYTITESIPLQPGADTTYRISVPRDSLYVGILSTDPQLPNKLGIYAAVLRQEDSVLFQFNFDRFSFDETRYANAHVDLYKTSSGLKRVHRLYKLPGDACSLFKYAGDGTIRLKDSLKQIISIEVSDFSGNISKTKAEITRIPDSTTIKNFCQNEIIPFGIIWEKTFENGLKLTLPASALYQNECLNALPVIPSDSFLTDIFPAFQEMATSLHKPGKIQIPLKRRIDYPKDKFVLVRMDPLNKVLEAVIPDSTNDFFIKAGFRNGGYFAATVDTIPPEVGKFFFETDPVDGKEYVACEVSDDLSGIKKIRVEVNGKWRLTYFDSKSRKIRWLRYTTEMGPHSISIHLTDNCNNFSLWKIAE